LSANQKKQAGQWCFYLSEIKSKAKNIKSNQNQMDKKRKVNK
jgi:hypothetical protein